MNQTIDTGFYNLKYTINNQNIVMSTRIKQIKAQMTISDEITIEKKSARIWNRKMKKKKSRTAE